VNTNYCRVMSLRSPSFPVPGPRPGRSVRSGSPSFPGARAAARVAQPRNGSPGWIKGMEPGQCPGIHQNRGNAPGWTILRHRDCCSGAHRVSKNHHFTPKVLHLEFDECKHCVDSAEFHLLRSQQKHDSHRNGKHVFRLRHPQGLANKWPTINPMGQSSNKW
jgi:hypothetical protein